MTKRRKRDLAYVDNNNDGNNKNIDHRLDHLRKMLAQESSDNDSDSNDDEVSIRSPPIESNSGPNRRS